MPHSRALAKGFSSFHYHLQLVGLLEKWYHQIKKTQPIPHVACPSGQNLVASKKRMVVTLVRAFREGHISIPYEINLQALFFLCNQESFVHHFGLWIRPQLQYAADRDGSIHELLNVSDDGALIQTMLTVIVLQYSPLWLSNGPGSREGEWWSFV
jgi:hypothetical protein